MLNLKKPNTYQTHTLVNFEPVFLFIKHKKKKLRFPAILQPMVHVCVMGNDTFLKMHDMVIHTENLNSN